MSNTQRHNRASRKKPRIEADLPDTSPEIRPSKKSRCHKLHSPAFYDSLSKVWLTRRALKELDRRTTQIKNELEKPGPTCWQEYQGYIWKKQLQRFARRGGPELSDLRGVYPIY